MARAAHDLRPFMSDAIRLLIVDDDEVDREILRRAVERSGLTAHVDEVGSARDAKARLAQRGRAYDCVILDHMLPDASGVDLVNELRAADVAVPILVVTGNQDDDTEQALVDAGATDYLPKGEVSPSRLARRLRFAMRVARAEAEQAVALEQA